MRFIIAASADPARKDAAPPPDEALVVAYMKYNEELHEAGVLVAAEGLNPAGRGARIGTVNGKRTVLDGPFTESKELVGGFYLISVDSLEEAIAWAMKCPTGMGTDDVLTIHPMTEEGDLPAEMRKLIVDAAPKWSATWAKAR